MITRARSAWSACYYRNTSFLGGVTIGLAALMEFTRVGTGG